jgi:ketosteroid isomerase-like protein
VREFYELLGQPHEASLRVAPGIVLHHTDMKTPWVGRESFRQHLETLAPNFETIHWNIEEVVAEGDFVAIRHTIRGRSRTGATLALPGMDFIRMKDGVIEEIWGIFDFNLLKSHLGP